MNLNAIKLADWAEEGSDCHLCHPSTGEPLSQDDGSPVSIRVRGMDSPPVKRHLEAVTGALRDGKKTDQREKTEALCVALIASWSGISLSDDGSPLELTPANVRTLIRAHEWIGVQIIEHAGNRRNFFSE